MKDFLETIGTAFACALILVIGVPLMIALAIICIAISPLILAAYLIQVKILAKSIDKFTKVINSKIASNNKS